MDNANLKTTPNGAPARPAGAPKPVAPAAAPKPMATADVSKPVATVAAPKPVATAGVSKPVATADVSKPVATAAAKPVAATAAPKPIATADVSKPEPSDKPQMPGVEDTPSKKPQPEATDEPKNPHSAKWRRPVSIAVLIIGLAMLAVGVVFLVLKLAEAEKVQDGEYLVAAGPWLLDEGNSAAQDNCVPTNEASDGAEATNAEAANCMLADSGVIWRFTEIGKGTLTTNNHLDDYNFIWALEGSMLKIETKWLYTLENEYSYSLDQSGGVLTLTDGDKEYRFVKLQN